ncbi:hypothetical protein BSK59_16250 [Paenibacillus odorifer]|uniref:hypothetical protein n=1 Tax=Paenibacillus odorifer TaxID=189426 RepID=UPI00096BE005|nr:hypothetical protein [Paenibacillus odorifer]OME54131.1 hypothetical protein BSK59_16250 [Paenibacillus odorifer]
MSKIDIRTGDSVVVVNNGKTFSRYKSLFEKIVEENNVIGVKHALGKQPIEENTYIVLAIGSHLTCSDEPPIALIHNNNKEVYLIGIEGLRLK